MWWVTGTLLFLFGGMAFFLWIGWWAQKETRLTLCPYSGCPLQPTTTLPLAAIGKVYLYMNGLREYDNRMFDIRKAAVSRVTGRIFPGALTLFGNIRLDWSFLQKRQEGDWVSWGSLSPEQQKEIRALHKPLTDFQTEHSSEDPSPRNVATTFALSKPGPLYVDLHTKQLMGWAQVPGTDLEVLVVKRPRV